MRSLDLNRRYYHECIAPILVSHFPEIAARHAGALIGWGSEILGNDDVHSRAYGWGPRVVLFLTVDDHTAWSTLVAQTLEAHVPPTFLGFPTRFTDPTQGSPQPTLEPGGMLQIPVTTCAAFLRIYLGLSNTDAAAPALPSRAWLFITEAGLLRLTAGEVYADTAGELTALRSYFAAYPDDVWRYRLAYGWTALSWDIDLIGLCAKRGDSLSARIATARSVERIVALTFLLNRVYKPGYLKWVHRQFHKLPYLAPEISDALERALTDADAAAALDQLYPVLDRLVAFQKERADLPKIEHRRPGHCGRGFFDRDLQPVIDALRASITGELRDLPCQVGALDQWVGDQDLLMSPDHLSALDSIYDRGDPTAARFTRAGTDHFL